MDNNNINPENNSFFSRSCCKTPKIFENTKTVFRHEYSKLEDCDWLKTIKFLDKFDCIEVKFKNCKKGF